MSAICRISLAATAACAVLLVSSPTSAQAEPPQGAREPTGLTVSASSEISVPPDRAIVRLGVLAQAPSAAQAQDRVNAVMGDVLDALAALGLPPEALRTEELSLTPVYGEQRRDPGPDPQREPRVVAYRASNVVGVEVAELARIGEIVDAGIQAGANQLQGIAFEIRDDAAARAEAMRRAVADARAQADAITDAMGMRIVSVREVVAGGYDVRPPRPYAGGRAVAELAATPVQPGQVEISSSVTVTYVVAPSVPQE